MIFFQIPFRVSLATLSVLQRTGRFTLQPKRYTFIFLNHVVQSIESVISYEIG
jgi:hypothetical protein